MDTEDEWQEDLPTYISFDVDALDPVYTPGTGTPEVLHAPFRFNVVVFKLILYSLTTLHCLILHASPLPNISLALDNSYFILH